MGKKNALKCGWMQISNRRCEGTGHIHVDAHNVFSLIFFWEVPSAVTICYWFS